MFNGRLKKAARLTWHLDYGANVNAVMRSSYALREMQLTDEEKCKVDKIVKWMIKETEIRGRWW